MSRLIPAAEMAATRNAAFDALEARLAAEGRGADLEAFRTARLRVKELERDQAVGPGRRDDLRVVRHNLIRLYVEYGGIQAAS